MRNLDDLLHKFARACAYGEVDDRINAAEKIKEAVADALTASEAECGALRLKAARYDWLRDNPHWSVSYRIKPGKTKQYRMRDDDGDLWGNWWPTHEQAIDHAMTAMGKEKA